MFQCYHSLPSPRGVPTLHTDASGTAPPDAFGPFRVLHQIGAGVLGPVYRAYQPDPGRLVAVKQFRLDLPPETAHRFVDALDRLIAADLTHLGIAAPLAAGMTENSPFLALDFVAADSFDVVIRDYGPAPVTEALRIASQLGGALDFAAAVNVFHGALHPRDVLVSTDDTRVTGLGIAQILDSLGAAAPIRRPYAAPERVAGAAWDRRSDIFSLAALVFEMLFGRRVVGVGGCAAEAITSIDGADATALRAIFTRALAEEPAERFATALEFADALHGALQQSESAPKPARSRRRRDPDERAPQQTLPREPDLPLILAVDSEPEPSDHPFEPARLFAEPDLPRIDAGLAQVPATHIEPPDSDAGADAGERHVPEPVRLDTDGELLAPLRPTDVHADDLDLRSAERERFGLDAPDVIEPAQAGHALGDDVPPASLRPDDDDRAGPALVERDRGQATAFGYAASLTETAIEESRSAVWPIALALTVGLLVGFAGGYGVATRDRAETPVDTVTRQSPAPEPSSAAAAPAGPTASMPGGGASAPPPSVVAEADARVAPEAPAPLPRAAAPAPARPTAPASPRARVTVRSTPSGARVIVDGRDAGTTPLTLDALARGTHVVRIAHQGYVTAQRRVRIGATQTAQSIEVALDATRPARAAAASTPAPGNTSGVPADARGATVGSLMVDSRPAGARVFVDGKMVGTTPMLLDAVAAGDHTVRLELDGFSPWTAASRVAGGERTRVSGSLEQR